ncbi:acyltransferase [Paenibacillus hamazuiensis]|uniref:acyltransferase n=1 Tax=Paenibacillus hamazuiensis TaxID=2936508 RepID=UPI00200C97E4|nr:acyltransferase [Paenibacillus hamazuiensis]
MKKQKLEEIEALRAFAFLAVVLQHAIGHYAYTPESKLADGLLLGFILMLTKFAVPMFIFITGLVLFYNYSGGVRYFDFMRKRLKDIVLPYLPWVVVYGAISYSLTYTSWADFREFGLLALTGKSSYHLWYIVMIFQFYMLFPPLRRVILWGAKFVGSARAAAVLLAVLGAAYIGLTAVTGPVNGFVGALGIPVIGGLFGEYADRNALYFIFYFVLGAAAGLAIGPWRSWLERWKTPLLSVYFAFILLMLYVIVSHFRYEPQLVIHYNDTLLVQPLMAAFLIVSVPAMHLIALAFSRRAGEKLRRAAAAVGGYSYTAYLAHALVLVGATWAADLLLPGVSTTVRTLLAFALCAAGSVLLAMVLRRAAAAVGLTRRKR